MWFSFLLSSLLLSSLLPFEALHLGGTDATSERPDGVPVVRFWFLFLVG